MGDAKTEAKSQQALHSGVPRMCRWPIWLGLTLPPEILCCKEPNAIARAERRVAIAPL